ncbi:MAG: oligosaccharide flippase family protein [Nitrospirae bacterium]|nr:oligosaccharide flippase family protein [Nitrospirota bacterium]
MLRIINKIKSHKLFNADGLKSRLLKGGMWLGAGGAIEQGLRLVRNMILTRILIPEVFGLMAIILAINAALESFTQVGIKEAIIQNPDSEDETYLNGAWWLSFGRSIGLFIMGVVGSLWIVEFYHIQKDLFTLQVSFLVILFNGALSARAYIALKKMEYKKWVYIYSGGGIIGIVVSIILSFIFHNVMALVIGFIFEAGARLVISFIMCPFIPRLKFKEEHLKSLYAFARGMFGLPILYFIYAQAAIFVMGKTLTKSEVGLYSMAFSLAQAPSMLIINMLNQILMPAFSSRQKDNNWLNINTLKSTRLFVILGMPACFFAALYSREILSIIYGRQYAVMSIPFAILFTTTLLGAFSSPMVNVYMAIGKPSLQRLFSGIRAALIIVLIYPAVKEFGSIGAASVVFLSMTISYIFQVIRMNKLTGLDIMKYWKIFIHGTGIAFIVIIMWLLTYNVFSRNPINNLIFGFIGCVVAYGIIGMVYFKSGRTKEVIT